MGEYSKKSTPTDTEEQVTFLFSDASPQRLDLFLGEMMPRASRTQLQRWIKTGHVQLQPPNNQATTVTSPAYKLRAGTAVILQLPSPARQPQLAPIAMDIPILFEDDYLIVIDKPAGIAVHPTASSTEPTIVHGLLTRGLSQVGGELRPGIVHRLDKDTTGAMVIAKTDESYHALAATFAAHTIERVYYALVAGRMGGGINNAWENPIGRDPIDRKKMAVTKKGGKHAITHVSTVGLWENSIGLLECRLETGRTHQIRVHATHAGYPLIGDRTYGKQRRKRFLESLNSARGIDPTTIALLLAYPRQALHAAVLGFAHPISGEALRFVSQLPPDYAALLKMLHLADPVG